MPIRNITLPMIPGYNLDPIEDITDKLPVNPNHSWSKLCGGERALGAITTIVVHHSGVLKSVGADAYTHAKNHINSKVIEKKGEPGIPYHVYCRYGKIFQVNDILDLVYGVASNNPYTVHICTEGDFTRDTFTDADRQALYGAILAVKAVLPKFKEIKGHNELNPTDCPAIDMNRVRDDIAKLELAMKSTLSPDVIKQKCYLGANQHNYLYNEYNKDPKGYAWLEPWLIELHDVMKERGMFFDKK